MNNDSDTATTETPLTWTRSKQQGSEGMTHRAEITIDGDSYNFIVDSPRKGYWTARGWNGGTFTLYREARTMKDAKAQAQAYADQVARLAAEAKARKAKARKAEAQQAAWQAEWDSRPIGADVSDLIEITPTPVADYVATYGTHMPPVNELREEAAEGLSAALSAAEAEDVAQLSGDQAAADEVAEILGDAIPVDLPDVVRPFTHMAEQLSNYMPSAVQRAAKAMRQFDWHLRRTCTCPTPSHRMSCGEGGRVKVVR